MLRSAKYARRDHSSSCTIKVTRWAKDLNLVERTTVKKITRKHVCVFDSQEVSLGNWTLVRKAGGVDIAFKFNKSVKLPPNETTTVWSSGEHKKHELPHTIVMKNQKWPTGDSFVTVLQNKDGEEMATSAAKKEKRIRTRSYGRHAFGADYPRVNIARWISFSRDREVAKMLFFSLIIAGWWRRRHL